jgi:cell division protease FtsH
LLRERRDQLEKITRGLLEREELSEVEIAELIGPSTHTLNAKKKAGKPEMTIAPQVNTAPSESSAPDPAVNRSADET